MLSIAYFISSHGYGHATRAAAVMTVIRQLQPNCRFEIFTQIPQWLFAESQLEPFGYHAVLTDIGVAQQDSLTEDLTETWQRLQKFLPFKAANLVSLARQINQLGCQVVMCDIAPLGIAVAKTAGVPSVLVENFTWDWIYEGYLYPESLQPQIDYLRDLFTAANYHIQTEPICQPRQVHLTTSPVSRRVRSSAKQIRQQLDIPMESKVVLITMGGVPWTQPFTEQLAHHSDFYFIMPGHEQGRHGNLIQTGQKNFFHPDLINASDAVVGKVGYSTLAEVYQIGVPFGYISRPRFRESPILAEFVNRRMSGLPIPETQFIDGTWLRLLPDLLALPRCPPETINGADQIAAQILAWGF